MTGTYRFKTGFYGATDMPAEFQRAMEYTLIGVNCTFCFLDDMLIVSKGSEEDHLKLITNCLQELDADNLRINLPKCHLTKHENSLLGYNNTKSGKSPIESKTSAILALQPPNTFKSCVPFSALHIILANFFPTELNSATL